MGIIATARKPLNFNGFRAVLVCRDPSLTPEMMENTANSSEKTRLDFYIYGKICEVAKNYACILSAGPGRLRRQEQ